MAFNPMMMSMPPADVRPFVIDLGQEIRVGPSKYDAQPTVVPAAARDTRLPPGEGSVRYAIQRGSITDFDALESILLGALLNNNPSFSWLEGKEGHHLMISDPILTPKSHRERLTQLAFEGLDVPGLYIQDGGVLSVMATGKQSGCAVDIGDGTIEIAPVLEGQLQAGAQRIAFGGQDLTAALRSALPAPVPDRIARGLRERCMRVAASAADFERRTEAAAPDPSGAPMLAETSAGRGGDPSPSVAANGDATSQPAEAGAAVGGGEASRAPDFEYSLPDGQKIRLEREGLLLSEALFRPIDARPNGLLLPVASFLSALPSPVPQLALAACMNHMDAGCRRSMAEMAFVCGGLSAVPGMNERFIRELIAIAPSAWNIREPPVCPGYMPSHTLERSTFVGASLMANIVFQTQSFVTKYEYSEGGPFYVQRKFQ